MKIFILFILLFNLTFARYEKTNIDKDIETLCSMVSSNLFLEDLNMKIDIKKLLSMTAMIESSYGQNDYKGRVAKTFMQIEEETANHYLPLVKKEKEFLENKLGRKIVWNNDRDAIFVAYLIYISKIKYHSNVIKKYYKEYFKYNDYEWIVYKSLYNTHLGASTFEKWRLREYQLAIMNKEILTLIKNDIMSLFV